ncbi:MAG: NTP transferase domain-containing protein [Candidatus Doudnabacteria bacterium]|nr:NTP transferase domain-containing protein [Candidatus Doudnabacteria bacterium]
MRNQFVILAAGKGTRMNNEQVPKVLTMLKAKPLILYLLEEIEKVGQLIKPVVVVGYMHKQVEAVLGDGFLYALQEQQLGTAHAVLAARKKVKAENILVLYGDMPFIQADSLKELINMHFKTGSKISMLTAQVESYGGIYESLEHYGRIIREPIEHNIVGIVEFKDASPEQRQIKEVNPGIYMFNAGWLWNNLDKIQNHNAQAEYYLTDIAKVAIEQGEKIHSLMINPKEVLGVNSRQDLAVAEEVLAENISG